MLQRLYSAWLVLTSRIAVVYYETRHTQDVRAHGGPDALAWNDIADHATGRCDQACADIVAAVEADCAEARARRIEAQQALLLEQARRILNN